VEKIEKEMKLPQIGRKPGRGDTSFGGKKIFWL